MNNLAVRKKRLSLILRALFLVLVSHAFLLQSFAQEQEDRLQQSLQTRHGCNLTDIGLNVRAVHQERHFPEQDFDFDNHEGNRIENAGKTQKTGRYHYGIPGQDSLVMQSAEQNKDIVIHDVTASLLSSGMPGDYNETYLGLKNFWSEDIVSNFFANIGQVIGRWITEFIDGWISQVVQFLSAALRTFVLNPNIAVSGLNEHSHGAGGQSDDISPLIRQAADVVYGIAVDLLLLLFILAIWRYWADAAWRGDVGLMGAVGRLVFTAGLMLAWPTIYAFEIQITNEMIKALYANSAGQLAMLDTAMALAVKAGLVAGVALLASAFAPVVGQVVGGAIGGAGGMVLGTVGGVVSFVGLIVYLVLGGILVGQLIYLLVLKAIQTALLTAQYMFAPVFLVCFATPDTENVTSGFVKSFVEVSLWTFFWVGLLKILVIILSSDFNPWGKIILTIGILQMMIQVPSFLARARISPMSNYISTGSISHGLMNGARTFADFALTRTQQWFKAQSEGAFIDASNAQSPSLKVNRLSNGLNKEPAFTRSNDIWSCPSGKEAPFNGERSKKDRTAVVETVLEQSSERGQEANLHSRMTQPAVPTAVAGKQFSSRVTAHPGKGVNEIAKIAQANLFKNIAQVPKSEQQSAKNPEELYEDGIDLPKLRNEESSQTQLGKVPGPPARTSSGAKFQTIAVPTGMHGSQDVIHRNVPLGNIPLQDLTSDRTTLQGLSIHVPEQGASTVSGGNLAETVKGDRSSQSYQSVLTTSVLSQTELMSLDLPGTAVNNTVPMKQEGLRQSTSSYVPAIKGVSTYIAALIKNDCPVGTPKITQDKIAFWIGCNIPQDKVNACLAITQSSPIGEKECEDIELVERVASTGMSSGNTLDAYKNAYLNYKYADSKSGTNLMEQMEQTSDKSMSPRLSGAVQSLPPKRASQSITKNSLCEKQLLTWDND